MKLGARWGRGVIAAVIGLGDGSTVEGVTLGANVGSGDFGFETGVVSGVNDGVFFVIRSSGLTRFGFEVESSVGFVLGVEALSPLRSPTNRHRSAHSRTKPPQRSATERGIGGIERSGTSSTADDLHSGHLGETSFPRGYQVYPQLLQQFCGRWVMGNTQGMHSQTRRDELTRAVSLTLQSNQIPAK